MTTTDKTYRMLYTIASDIRADWAKVNYAAAPYLAAMGDLGLVSDNYGYDSGKGIVLYFLSNAGGWRGPVAKKIKAELRGMVK